MEWFLGVSVVLNILLLALVSILTYLKVNSDNEALYYLTEYKRWEERFYEAQAMALEEYDLFIAPTMGEYGSMIIKNRSLDKPNNNT